MSKYQGLLAIALAMVNAVHLLTIKRLHHKFQQLALAVPRDQLLRGPTLQEALDADKSVWNAVLAVQIENKWPFNDALNEVAYCRQEMQSLLQPRIRTQSRPDKRQAPDHPKSPGKIAKSTKGAKATPSPPHLLSLIGFAAVRARAFVCVTTLVLARQANHADIYTFVHYRMLRVVFAVAIMWPRITAIAPADHWR